MPVVAALAESGPPLAALRRLLPRSVYDLSHCRSYGSLERLLAHRYVDAIIAGPSLLQPAQCARLRERYGAIPLTIFGDFRPDDGPALAALHALDVAQFIVHGVDDAVVGELLGRCTLTHDRASAMRDAPRVLRLDAPLQRRVWRLVLAEVESPLRTADLADRLSVSREHLSRQFAAGGAPHLKRVIDLARIAAAAQLAANAGYTLADVARLLGFTSPSHFSATARRIVGGQASSLASLGPRGVLVAYLRQHRSRGMHPRH